MKAMAFERPARIEARPLQLIDIAKPEPKSGELVVDVSACGVCRTDLHIIEGDLPIKKPPIVPGHQVVGTIAEIGSGVGDFKKGDRVGITWINSTCDRCELCKSGRENLCESAQFTGYDTFGGYAEQTKVSHRFAYKIPDGFDDIHAAPLLCGGIVGYRALKMSGVKPGGTLAMFGFGSSASMMAQVAKRWGCEIHVYTRSAEHQELAKKLGASWVGGSGDAAPGKADAAILFAPAGELVINALSALKKGGRLAIADIYTTQIPQIDYARHLYNERSITSVTNYARADATEFLDMAATIPIKTEVKAFSLGDANTALLEVKQSRVNGSAVLKI